MPSVISSHRNAMLVALFVLAVAMFLLFAATGTGEELQRMPSGVCPPNC